MKLNNLKNLFLALACVGAFASCSGSSTEDAPVCVAPAVTAAVPLASIPAPTGAFAGIVNGMKVTVNGSQCTGSQYFNEPCVSVTICKPNDGEAHCQVINNLLLDTGSYGLRIFKSVLSVQLEQAYQGVASGGSHCAGGANAGNLCWDDNDCPSSTCGSHKIMDCAFFGDGSTDWGYVQYADVQLGGEPIMHSLPIHVIDSSARGVSSCGSSPDAGPCDAFFNGILGIGLDVRDNTSNYMDCDSLPCASFSPLNYQTITNPISFMAADNNGTIFKLPDMTAATTGVASLDGTLVFGIDTRVDSPTTIGNAGTTLAPSPGTAVLHTPVKYAVDPGSLTLQVTYGGVQSTCATGSSNPTLNCTQDHFQCSAGANVGGSCIENSDCPDTTCAAGLNFGHACNVAADCPAKTCVGGANIGHVCNVDGNCPASTCTYTNGVSTCTVASTANCLGQNYCVGGVNTGDTCTANSDCPGSTCQLAPMLYCTSGVNQGKVCTTANPDCPINNCAGGVNAGHPCMQNNECPTSTCSVASGTFSTCVATQTTGSDNVSGLGIIDSGSNGLYFPDAHLPCAGGSSFYCPLAAVSLFATNAGDLGAPPSVIIPLFIVNFGTLLNSGHSVFYNIGADAGPGGDFDWGLPFFMGRNVYTGISGSNPPTLGAGPFWAY